MEIFMFHCVSADGEGLITNLAFVASGTFMCSDMHFDVIFGSISIIANMTGIFSVLVVFYGMYREGNVVFVGLTANVALNRFVQFYRRGVNNF